VAQARIANLTPVLVADASHDLTFARPERVNRAVTDFLGS
jgi:pimeloyl-ACP methyl ester carboxylesterase